MELPKEPDPKSIPIATGAVTSSMQKWISVIVLGCIFCFVVIGWAISRWSGPSKGIMGARQEKKQDKGKAQSASKLNEEREKAYEQGRIEERKWWNQNGKQSSQEQKAQLTPKQQARQEYEKLLHDAAMTDNMVEGRNKDGTAKRNTEVSGLDTPGLDPLSSRSHPLLVHGARNVSDGRELRDSGDRPRDASHEDVDRKTPVRTLPANTLPEGTIIYGTLVNQLNGDNTGPVAVQVSNDIPYPGTDEVAIPQGSLFLGEAQKVSAQFQQRLAVTFHRLQIGRTADNIRQIELKAPALDQQGAAALSGKVDNHYASIFGTSLAVGAIGGLSQIGSGSYGGYGGIDAGTQVRNGISQSTAQSSSQILNRFLTRLPTVKIAPGTIVVIYLRDNLEIPR